MQKRIVVKPTRGNTVPLVTLVTAEKELPITEEKINAGCIIPVTMVFLNVNMLIVALGATAFIALGLIIMFPWHHLFRALLYLFCLPLFMLLSLRSLDRVRQSIHDLICFEHPTEYIAPLRLRGRFVAAKDTWKAFAAVSVVFTCLSCLWFYTAYARSGNSFTVSHFLGCVSVALGIFLMAVSIDVKKANTA